MRTGSVLVVIAVLLAVLGAGASYSGYNQSLQALTVTSTQALTVTSTKTVATTSTESFVMTTRSTGWILESEVISLSAPGQHYCGWYDYRPLSLDAGQVHVSYRTDGRPVDFWLLTADDFKRWEARHTCEDAMAFYGVAHKFGSKAYESIVALASGGDYYIVFMNSDNYHAVVVTLDVDAGIQERQFTMTAESIMYSTYQTEYPTQIVAAVARPAGLGLVFFSGIGLVVLALVVLVISRRKGAPSPAVAPVAPATPAIPPTHEAAAGKFCVNCGAQLPAHAMFCNKCGSKQ